MPPHLDSLSHAALRAGSLMLVQSAILVGVLWTVDRIVGHRMRAALRHALWMLVVFKLLLPPSLLLPTGAGFWLGRWLADPVVEPTAPRLTVTTPSSIPSPQAIAELASPAVPSRIHPPDSAVFLCLAWGIGSLVLVALMLRRHRVIRSLLRHAVPAPPRFDAPLRAAAAELNLQAIPGLRLTLTNHSPAVCGLFRPTILLPAALAESLDPASLRDVLLHEVAHIRRRDLPANLLQSVVQTLWWWNPLVWMANARIRALREQAVDERVMTLGTHNAPTYPQTLIAIARHCTASPALALSFIGILERPTGLGTRIKRLIEVPLPTRAELGISGWIAVAVAALVALPMAYARRVERAPSFPSALPAVDLLLSTNSTDFTVNGDHTVTRAQLPAELKRLAAANGGALMPVLRADPRVPVTLRLDALIRIGEAGISSVFYETSIPNPPKGITSFGTRLATHPLTSSGTNRVVVLGILNDGEDYAIDGTRLSAPLSEASVRLEAALREHIRWLVPSVSLVIEMTWKTKPDQLHAVLIGAERLGFHEIALAYNDTILSAAAYSPPTVASVLGDPQFRTVVNNLGENPTSTPPTNAAPSLYTRTFRVNPVNFASALSSVLGSTLPEPGKQDPPAPTGWAMQAAVRDFLVAAGARFPNGAENFDPSGASDRGALFYNDRTGILFVRATKEDLAIVESALQVLNVAPPQIRIEAQFLELDADVVQKHLDAQYRLRTDGASPTPGAPAKALPGPTFTGLLADEEHRALLAALRSEPGTKFLAKPNVITLSGRQAQIQVADLVPVVDRAANKTNMVPIGPTFDVIPYVTADDKGIDLTMIASLSQLDGPTDDPQHPPVINTRSMTTSAITRSGQTLVLAGASGSGAHRRELLVFVTATIVDPAGNPAKP